MITMCEAEAVVSSARNRHRKKCLITGVDRGSAFHQRRVAGEFHFQTRGSCGPGGKPWPDPVRCRVAWRDTARSGEYSAAHFAVDVFQTVSLARVFQAGKVERRGVEVVDMRGVVDDFAAGFVGPAVE